MSNTTNVTYVYVIAQHPNNIIRFDILPIKIGYSERLDDRINKFDGEQWCTKPKYVRILEFEKKHKKPDKVFHKMFHELIEDSRIEMIDKNRELFKVDNLDIIDEVMTFLSEINPKSKYYKDPDDIEELVYRDSIIKDIVKNLVNDVISENEDIGSDNSDNLDMQLIDIPDNTYEIIKNFVTHGSIVKWVIPQKPKPDQHDEYYKKKYISIIENHIPDTEQFIRTSEYPRENKEEILKILDITDKNIKEWARSNDLLKKPNYTYPNCILGIIKKYFESQ